MTLITRRTFAIGAGVAAASTLAAPFPLRAQGRIELKYGNAGNAATLSNRFNTTLAEVIALVQKLSGHHMDVAVNPAFVRLDEVKTLCGSRARLETVIGPLAMPPLEDTIAWMLGG